LKLFDVDHNRKHFSYFRSEILPILPEKYHIHVENRKIYLKHYLKSISLYLGKSSYKKPLQNILAIIDKYNIKNIDEDTIYFKGVCKRKSIIVPVTVNLCKELTLYDEINIWYEHYLLITDMILGGYEYDFELKK